MTRKQGEAAVPPLVHKRMYLCHTTVVRVLSRAYIVVGQLLRLPSSHYAYCRCRTAVYFIFRVFYSAFYVCRKPVSYTHLDVYKRQANG